MNKSQEQIDFEATTDFWIWESENGSGRKTDWPEYNRIIQLNSQCSFCHYFNKYCYDNGCNDICESCIECEDCWLVERIGNCNRDDSTFDLWRLSGTKKDHKKYALIIANACIQYCKDRWG